MSAGFTEPNRSALLILHLQPLIVDMHPGADELMKRIAEAASAARQAGVDVMYVNIGFRPGYPEVPEEAPARAYMVAEQILIAGVNNPVHDAVAPLEGEIQFTNPRANAFSGTDLESVLRAKHIDHIVLAGIATSGVVLGTVTDADDRNYRITVLSDGVMDNDQELHEALLKVFVTPPRKARVITIDDWRTELGGQASND